MLSVIIITKNEEAHIVACLESVQFADEIIVLDSGSTDKTCELATAHGAQVHHTTDWPGFGVQKNRALALATHEWVLSIDADERVPEALAAEIQSVLRAPQANAYSVARLSCFAGRWIRHSGWWPDRLVRLFKRDAGRFKDVRVHESVVVEGLVAELRGHLLHYPYDSLETLITKTNFYSTAAALSLYEKGKHIPIAGIALKAFWTFIRIYVLRRGFLDGRAGFILAGVAASGSFFRYSKLWLLNRKTNWQPKPPPGE
ncbi:LPS biosynthesis protein [Paenalcaligenes hominis]|uniref:LPS biosynthesis protein n=1 Tax=Paenalcaligenes hominis TaxID=643674 RepID=A0A1U9K2C3_9BURK|nr:glycosyltransferase family 2 protein [Paenalcaligenes hominis]AQS52187.1 LPS biosynthesis protein [Paenalcaligenes hominis]